MWPFDHPGPGKSCVAFPPIGGTSIPAGVHRSRVKGRFNCKVQVTPIFISRDPTTIKYKGNLIPPRDIDDSSFDGLVFSEQIDQSADREGLKSGSSIPIASQRKRHQSHGSDHVY
jgi:hypothetical protein